MPGIGMASLGTYGLYKEDAQPMNENKQQQSFAHTGDRADDQRLDQLQRATFQYFLKECNPENGLVADNTKCGAPASITAVGLALAAYPVGVERGYLTRQEALQRTLVTLRFFAESPHSTAPDAVGHRGFYYHFLDMKTGARVWESALSTIDTTFLLAGALAAATYFDGDAAVEGVERHFSGYLARGAPYGPDDGTISPWGAIGSLPFAPELVLPLIHALDEQYPGVTSKYGFKCSFNPTFVAEDGDSGASGWISEGYYGLDQGPIVLMIENYRSGLFWQLMRSGPYLRTGLQRAGFTGGWLDAD
jgi:hypothetical protein